MAANGGAAAATGDAKASLESKGGDSGDDRSFVFQSDDVTARGLDGGYVGPLTTEIQAMVDAYAQKGYWRHISQECSKVGSELTHQRSLICAFAVSCIEL